LNGLKNSFWGDPSSSALSLGVHYTIDAEFFGGRTVKDLTLTPTPLFTVKDLTPAPLLKMLRDVKLYENRKTNIF
jgi:hypothetical protein